MHTAPYDADRLPSMQGRVARATASETARWFVVRRPVVLLLLFLELGPAIGLLLGPDLLGLLKTRADLLLLEVGLLPGHEIVVAELRPLKTLY